MAKVNKKTSYRMSRVKSRNTSIERLVCSALHKQGLRFRKHLKSLKGNPDLVFSKIKFAIFVDGDFWHGHHFRSWQHKLDGYWKNKIQNTIRRDKLNRKKLNKEGWTVICIWESDLKKNYEKTVSKLARLIQKAYGQLH